MADTKGEENVEVQLKYGKGHIQLHIPEDNFAGIIQPRKGQASKDITGRVRQALEEARPSLEEIVARRRVCVLVEDGTRAEPHEVLIEEIARGLVAARDLTFIVATGSHEPDSMRNREIVKAIHGSCHRHGISSYRVVVHDALKSQFTLLGETSRGTRVRVNKAALGHDVFVVAADMKNHYFAGYSNALKDFLPGICDYAAIEANHSLALEPESTFGRHPLHPNPARRSNPVAEDMLEATRLILGECPAFVLAAVTSGPYILWASGGDLYDVTAEGIRRVDEAASFTVNPTRHIIVSPGGAPQDESLYNAQRGLELTKNAVIDGGEILFLAECPKGVAPTPAARTHFYDQLTQPLPQVLSSIRRKYKLYTHKAYKFAELIQRVKRIWIHTTLPQDQVKSAHLAPAPNPQAVIDEWIGRDPHTRILIFNEANKIAIYTGTN